jgi:hypothetical protein
MNIVMASYGFVHTITYSHVHDDDDDDDYYYYYYYYLLLFIFIIITIIIIIEFWVSKLSKIVELEANIGRYSLGFLWGIHHPVVETCVHQ